MGIGNSELGKLDANEVKILRSTWEDIMKNAGENGPYIFGTFLKKYNYASYFKKFSNLKPDEIEQSKTFKDHSLLLMTTIQKLLLHSGTEEELINEFFKLGRLHGGKNLTRQQFLELKSTVIDIMDKKLRLPSNTLKVWSKALDISYFYIFQALEAPKSTTAGSSSK